MGFATHLGPWLLGTIKNTTGTTVGTNVANGTIYKNLNHDLLTDLVPVARLPQNPMLIVSSAQVAAKDLKELVAWLKANPDKIPGGTAGMGSGSHLGALAFFAATDTLFCSRLNASPISAHASPCVSRR